MPFDRYDHKIPIDEAECSRNWKTNRKKKEGTSKPSPKKACFMNKANQTSQAKINTSNSNFNEDIPQWIEAICSEEEDIGMRKGRRKNNVGIKNEEVKGKIAKRKRLNTQL